VNKSLPALVSLVQKIEKHIVAERPRVAFKGNIPSSPLGDRRQILLLDPDSLQAMLPALKHNVIAALGTPALLAVGYLLKAAY